jgi:tetratricopeptide (TPR) repeat protein
MLGNAYDDNGQRGKARDAYNEGLKKFPNAGRLYLELGTTYWMENDYDHAVSLWEKGVEVQPCYPSNYYMTSSKINLDPKKTFIVPFRLVYTLDFLVGLTLPTALDSPTKELNITMLSKVRVSLIDLWFNQKKRDREYPNILLDFQRSLCEQGLLEAYNFWLLSEGNKPEFEQ